MAVSLSFDTDKNVAIVTSDAGTLEVTAKDIDKRLINTFVVAGVIKRFAEFRAGKKGWTDKDLFEGYQRLLTQWAEGEWGLTRGGDSEPVLKVALRRVFEDMGKEFTDAHYAKYEAREDKHPTNPDATPPYTEATRELRRKVKLREDIQRYMAEEQEARSRKTISVVAATDDEL